MADDEAAQEPWEPFAREGQYIAPETDKEAYHCPVCGVLAAQNWIQPTYPSTGGTEAFAPVKLVRCFNCKDLQVWVEYGTGLQLVRPWETNAPRPHHDMPTRVGEDYEEGRAVLSFSPRSCCALLRLATEKLVEQLQPEGRDLNDRIGRLVEDGLPVQVQQALDTLRVIGNEAVHPGELDLRDDAGTASGLFELVNFIVEDRITRPRHIAEMYSKIPAAKLEGIENRDNPMG
jgi:hypothetical protein